MPSGLRLSLYGPLCPLPRSEHHTTNNPPLCDTGTVNQFTDVAPDSYGAVPEPDRETASKGGCIPLGEASAAPSCPP